VHEQRARTTSPSSDDEDQLGRAHFVTTTARAQGGTAHISVPDFDGIRVNIRLRVQLCLEIFLGDFSSADSAPAATVRLTACGKTSAAPYFTTTRRSSTSAPTRGEQNSGFVEDSSGFQWASLRVAPPLSSPRWANWLGRDLRSLVPSEHLSTEVYQPLYISWIAKNHGATSGKYYGVIAPIRV
jgi:hypothetical protein